MRDAWLYGCRGLGSSYRARDAEFPKDARTLVATPLSKALGEGGEGGSWGIKWGHVRMGYNCFMKYIKSNSSKNIHLSERSVWRAPKPPPSWGWSEEQEVEEQEE
jgi:hypothetical protein